MKCIHVSVIDLYNVKEESLPQFSHTLCACISGKKSTKPAGVIWHVATSAEFIGSGTAAHSGGVIPETGARG